MIDEKKLIEDIFQHEQVLKMETDIQLAFANGYKQRDVEIRNIIERQPQADKWIPCEERLPLPKGNEQMVEVDVTVAGDGRNVRVPAFYFFATCNFHVYGIGGAKIKNVIAWMPKPEPYKKDHSGEATEMVKEGAE